MTFGHPPAVSVCNCRLVHSSANIPFEIVWATQPIVRQSGEDHDLQTVAKESTPKDRRRAADLLFQKKKKAYYSKCALWWKCYMKRNVWHSSKTMVHNLGRLELASG